MMMKTEDKNNRYYIDLDLRTRKIINWDYDQRDDLAQELTAPYQRVFITKGQYNKLEMKNLEIQKSDGNK